jgi:hypothetical protein
MATQSSTQVIHVTAPTAKAAEDETKAQTSNVWQLFFQQCLHERIQSASFHKLSGQLWDEQRVGGLYLVDSLLGCQRTISTMSDPLITGYLEDMLFSGRVSISDVLNGLLQRSRYRQLKPSREPKNSPDLECTVIMFAARQLLTNNGPKVPHQSRNLLHSLLEWMRAVIKSDHILMDQNGTQLCDAIGILAVATLENAEIVAVTQRLQKTSK